ncbi:MAG: hypothetical protein ACPMAG_06560 [Limisphaerales bacterium]|jgi:uncharacterized protein CbrC (UPF0167 family)
MKSNAEKFYQILARVCLFCPLCNRARKHQYGIAFKIVSMVETKLCPFCRAYHQVYGRKASERIN